jgi:hypothetical protein
MHRIAAVLALAGLTALPARARAQVPLFAAAMAGGAFNTDDNSPAGSGAGLAFQADLGLRLARVQFGAEFAQHTIGNDLKTRIYGGFVRVPSMGNGPVRAYLVAGLASYRFSPSGGRSSSTIGGSLGPGVSFQLGDPRVAVLLEARFHSSFSNLPRINTQQFVSIAGGLRLGL